MPGVLITAAGLHRGFTMHEHLDQVGLIHMGGRVYDPEIGRFLSPDPFVQFPASTQGFNRYAYVGNNPLSFTDPSGYFSLKALVKTAVAVVATVYLGPVIGGAVAGYLSTGTVKGAMLGALAGAVAAGIGGKFGEVGYAEPGKLVGRSFAHGVTQGAISKAGGGRFGDGALGAFASSMGGPAIKNVSTRVGQAMTAAAVGGTASAIGGGKFGNGAVTGAFAYTFGSLAQRSSVSTGGRALNGIKGRLETGLRVAVGDPGELTVAYPPSDVVQIYDALVTLADAQGMDFHTDVLFGPEREMLMRVLVGHGDQYTVGWFHHESAEFSRINATIGAGATGPAYVGVQRAAHDWVIQQQGAASPLVRYHPAIVNAYRDQF